MHTCVCIPAAVQAPEELHARSKGYLTPVDELRDMSTDIGPILQKRVDICIGKTENGFYRLDFPKPFLDPTSLSLS